MNSAIAHASKERNCTLSNGYRRVPWISTCKVCPERGSRFDKEEWMFFSAERSPSISEDKCRELAKYPERCTSCNTKSVRYARMKRSLDKLVDIKRQLAPRGKYSKLKMITVNNKNGLTKEEFTKRWLKFRNETPWLIGGTYVLEQGKNPQGDYDGMWHMHGVFIAPYIEKEYFDDLTLAKSGEHYGLGNVHYQVAKLDRNLRSSWLENYIAKYMCKEGNRKQSFGALYRCQEDWIRDNEGNKLHRFWTQPNVQKYTRMMNDWKGLVEK